MLGDDPHALGGTREVIEHAHGDQACGRGAAGLEQPVTTGFRNRGGDVVIFIASPNRAERGSDTRHVARAANGSGL